jgi:putative inorganic carbon (hco3(-)) transporter
LPNTKKNKRVPGKAQQAKPAPRPAAEREAPTADLVEMSVARRVSWWVLLALVFVVPIAMSNFTFLGFRTPFTFDQFEIVKIFFLRVLTLVALAAWAWDLLRRGGKLRHTRIDWLILAFIVWVAITTATSVHWPTALFGKPRRYEGLLTFANFAVIYFLMLQFVDGAARVRSLAKSLFFSSVIVAAYGVLQFLGWDPAKWGGLAFESNRAFSTFGNPDLLGGFLIFSTSVALGLALAEKHLRWRLLYWAGFALNGVCLIVSFTRGAWIGGAVSIALVGVVAWRQRTGLRRADWIPVGVSAALGVGIIARSLSSGSQVMNFAERLKSIFQFGSGSGQTRTEIWTAALRAIKHRPLQGYGADTFRLVFPKFKPLTYVRDAGGASVADNAHNYPLQLATGLGIPGVLLMYGVFVWAGIRSFGTVFRRSDDSSRLLVGAFWAAAAGHLVHLMFSVPAVGSTFLLWAALGVVLAPTARVVEVKKRRWGTAAAAVIIVVAAAGIGYQGVPLAADHYYLVSGTNGEGPARAQAVRRAVSLNPYNGSYRTELGQAYEAEVRGYLATASAAKNAGQDASPWVEMAKQSFTKGVTALEDAMAFQPDEYDNYVSLGDLYNLGGQTLDGSYYTEAMAIANRGLQIEPYGTYIRTVLGYALLSTGKTDEGISVLEASMQMDPRDSRAALLLAQAYERNGRANDALALLRSVEKLRPGQAGVAGAIKKLEAGSSSP